MVEQQYSDERDESKMSQASQVAQGNTKGVRELRYGIAAASRRLAHFAQQQQQARTGSKQRMGEYIHIHICIYTLYVYMHMSCHSSSDRVQSSFAAIV